MLSGNSPPPALYPVFPRQWTHLKWVRDLLIPGCFLFQKARRELTQKGEEEGGGYYQTRAHDDVILTARPPKYNDIIIRSWSNYELLKVVFIMKLDVEFIYMYTACFFLLLCVTVRSPYLVTSTPYHPPPRQKRSNASVSFHPKALRSKSTPSVARDRWVTAVKSSGTQISSFSENVSFLRLYGWYKCSAWPCVVSCPLKYNLQKIHLVTCALLVLYPGGAWVGG